MFRLSIFTFFIFSSFTVVNLYLPLYFQFQGFSNGEIGLIMGIGSFIVIFSQPFWGLVSDHFKTIKKVLTTVLIIGALISIPMFASTTLAYAILFLILFMVFFSSAGPLTESLIVKYANENNRNFGTIRLWGELGFGAAALLLGITMEKLGMGVLGWLFIGMIVISLISMYWLPDAKPTVHPVTKQSLYLLFTNRAYLLFLGLQLMLAIPHRMNDTFLPIYIMEHGGLQTDVGTALLVATFSAVPTMALMGILLNKYSELLLIIIAAFFYIVRWSLFGLISDPKFILIFQVTHMLTFPIVLVASVQFIYKIVPRELMATGQTLFIAVFFGMGGIIGSFSGGWIMENFQSNILYFVAASLCLAGFIMMLICFPYFARQRKNAISPSHD